MKPGPPPIPFPLQRLRGNPGKRRLHVKPEPEREAQCPEPPPFLEPHAMDEWYRVGEQLHRLGLLTVVDTMPLAAYCAAYGRWRTAEEALARVAANDPSMHGFLVKTTDGVRRNPLLKVAADAADAMLRAASEFGMSPAARSRLAAGVGGAESLGKFEGLLSDG